MKKKNSGKPRNKGLNDVKSIHERNRILTDAMRLVKEKGMSIRAAARASGKVSHQHLAKTLKVWDGTNASIADKRAQKNGKHCHIDISSEGWLYVLGFKAAGQGSYKKAIRQAKRERKQLRIPLSQIPTIDQVYYARKKTPALFLPAFNKSRADYYDEMKMRTARAKYRPNELMNADEMVQKLFTYTGEPVKAWTFVAGDRSSGIIRRPYTTIQDFNSNTLISALKTVHKSAPTLGLPNPCCPEELKIDNLPLHSCLSVDESEIRFAEEMKLPFRIRHSIGSAPKSNSPAERKVRVVREFCEAFENYLDILAQAEPNVKVYLELYEAALDEFVGEWNNSKPHGSEYTRSQLYHLKSVNPERMHFDEKIIDKCFREYRTVKFEQDQGVKIEDGIHLDHEDLVEFRGKDIIVALNPDNLEENAPAYIQKSKKAPLRYIGELVHAEANPDLKNKKIGLVEQKIKLATEANIIVAASFVEKRNPVLEQNLRNIMERSKSKKKDKILKNREKTKPTDKPPVAKKDVEQVPTPSGLEFDDNDTQS